jgi:branched-chain amino acid transport system ATP-binding protein
MSVLDNVALGVAERHGMAARLWHPASRHHRVREEVCELLETLGLADDARKRLVDLPYGKQRLVEIAIALGLKPRVLLLDEPAAGVPSLESGMILKVFDRLPEDIAILIIEHDMDVVFRFAQRITVLVEGKVLCEGTPAEIAGDARVQQVYLGERHG